MIQCFLSRQINDMLENVDIHYTRHSISGLWAWHDVSTGAFVESKLCSLDNGNLFIFYFFFTKLRYIYPFFSIKLNICPDSWITPIYSLYGKYLLMLVNTVTMVTIPLHFML